jgi:predicted Zn-ribbon and HTH transcriptional regulator
MGMELIQLWGYRCQRCGHEWVPRDKTQKPRVCPKCKNPYWDRPRKNEKQDVEGGKAGNPQEKS